MQAIRNLPIPSVGPIAPMRIDPKSGSICGSGKSEGSALHLDEHHVAPVLDRSGLDQEMIAILVRRGQAFHLDEPELLDKLDNPTFPLNTPLQALLAASAQSLKSDASQANAEKVILETLEQCSLLLEQNVVVLSYNTELSNTRRLVFRIFHRLGKILGRNTVEAVRADTRAMLIALGDRIAYRPGQGKRADMTPSEHVDKVISPLLDVDMRPYALIQSMYSFPAMESFHSLIKTWRRRGHDLGKIVTEVK